MRAEIVELIHTLIEQSDTAIRTSEMVSAELQKEVPDLDVLKAKSDELNITANVMNSHSKRLQRIMNW
jgi:hypothetical protein